MMRNARKFKQLVIFPLCALFFFIGAITAQAATYYVATTGSNSNSGTTSGSPFLTIQRCVDIVAAGDTCTVADGTYTDADGNGIVAYISRANGTAGAPITIKSTNPHGAIVTVPGIDSLNAAFYVARSYYIIEGFDISGSSGTGGATSHHGIYFTSGATGGVARNNHIHGIARTLCYNTSFGNVGIFVEAAGSLVIENNLIYSIGRLLNGESGCSTDKYHHDHGVYIKGGANLVIKNNVFYDTNRGWPIHVYGGTVTNLSVYHNTFANHNTMTTIHGHILLASTITTANIKNNISYDATTGFIECYSLTASGITVSFNLSDTLEKSGTQAGVTFSNNLQNTSPGFVNAAVHDFHLTSGSVAINAGTNVGLPFINAAPDIGAYEFSTQGGDTSPPASPANLSIR